MPSVAVSGAVIVSAPHGAPRYQEDPCEWAESARAYRQCVYSQPQYDSHVQLESHPYHVRDALVYDSGTDYTIMVIVVLVFIGTMVGVYLHGRK